VAPGGGELEVPLVAVITIKTKTDLEEGGRKHEVLEGRRRGHNPDEKRQWVVLEKMHYSLRQGVKGFIGYAEVKSVE